MSLSGRNWTKTYLPILKASVFHSTVLQIFHLNLNNMKAGKKWVTIIWKCMQNFEKNPIVLELLVSSIYLKYNIHK